MLTINAIDVEEQAALVALNLTIQGTCMYVLDTNYSNFTRLRLLGVDFYQP